ncbi:29249_t:CDS:2, partial [Gigaspora margarita]
MPTNLWNSTPFDTNIAESAHACLLQKKTEELSSNYAEFSNVDFQKKNGISIKERQAALEIKKKQESLIAIEKQKLENE